MSTPLPSSSRTIDRRTALKWLAVAAAAMPLLDRAALATGLAPTAPARGYGTDPDLQRLYEPGELWPLTLDASRQATVVALCELIIPAETGSPGAVTVGVPAFIDEWVSAPYERQRQDRDMILAGLAWLDAESIRRFGRDFVAAGPEAQRRICDDICHAPRARPEHREAAAFFARFRDLVAGGYYTTPEGMTDLGYTGNVVLARFDGPPPEALRHVGLA